MTDVNKTQLCWCQGLNKTGIKSYSNSAVYDDLHAQCNQLVIVSFFMSVFTIDYQLFITQLSWIVLKGGLWFKVTPPPAGKHFTLCLVGFSSHPHWSWLLAGSSPGWLKRNVPTVFPAAQSELSLENQSEILIGNKADIKQLETCFLYVYIFYIFENATIAFVSFLLFYFKVKTAYS